VWRRDPWRGLCDGRWMDGAEPLSQRPMVAFVVGTPHSGCQTVVKRLQDGTESCTSEQDYALLHQQCVSALIHLVETVAHNSAGTLNATPHIETLMGLRWSTSTHLLFAPALRLCVLTCLLCFVRVRKQMPNMSRDLVAVILHKTFGCKRLLYHASVANGSSGYELTAQVVSSGETLWSMLFREPSSMALRLNGDAFFLDNLDRFARCVTERRQKLRSCDVLRLHR
jgi:hypothetical protein